MTLPSNYSELPQEERNRAFAAEYQRYAKGQDRLEATPSNGTSSFGEIGWPDPLPIRVSLPPVKPFDPNMLPEPLRAYVIDVAERQQSVSDFVAVVALCGLASLVGNRIRIAPKQHDDWIEVPNLWGAIIGAPSAMKSPAMTAALAPLYAIEGELRAAWQAECDAADIEEVLSVLGAKEAQKRAAKAVKAGDKESARSILADASARTGDASPCPRLVVNDATVEKLGELLNENPRGLLLVRDELAGQIARLESEEAASERAFYLEAFNGSGRFTYDRIGRGTIHIANCTLSIIGGIQPSRIAPLVRGALDGSRNDGLIQRLQLAVWPDSQPSWRWVDRHPRREARQRYEEAFRALHKLELTRPDQPAVFRFSAEAQDLFREWMEGLQTEARSGRLSPVLESHLLKMPKTIASLALIFELVDGGRFEVGGPSVRRALVWADYLRSHANRVYAAAETMVDDGARLILERRDQLPAEFTVRDIHRRAWAGLTEHATVVRAVELLIATDRCREIERPARPSGGRPTEVYCWNPKLVAAR